MKELPEAGLVRKTITLREMDLPPEVKLTKKSLLRWFALSTGLILALWAGTCSPA